MYLINLITIVDLVIENIIIIKDVVGVEEEVKEIKIIIMIKDKNKMILDMNMLRKLNE